MAAELQNRPRPRGADSRPGAMFRQRLRRGAERTAVGQVTSRANRLGTPPRPRPARAARPVSLWGRWRSHSVVADEVPARPAQHPSLSLAGRPSTYLRKPAGRRGAAKPFLVQPAVDAAPRVGLFFSRRNPPKHLAISSPSEGRAGSMAIGGNGAPWSRDFLRTSAESRMISSTGSAGRRAQARPRLLRSSNKLDRCPPVPPAVRASGQRRRRYSANGMSSQLNTATFGEALAVQRQRRTARRWPSRRVHEDPR